jgi:hypothetical protein
MKYRYLGANSIFVAQGTGLCSLKSSSDIRVSNSGYNDGSLIVDVDPSAEYSAQVIMTCSDGLNEMDTNTFKIDVKCMANTPNLYISEVLTLAYANGIQFKPNGLPCKFHFYPTDIKSTSAACPYNGIPN